nr:hypothetical protein [uncultured archaeon]
MKLYRDISRKCSLHLHIIRLQENIYFHILKKRANVFIKK